MTQSTKFIAQIDKGESLDLSKNEMLALLSLIMYEVVSDKDITEDTLITILIKKNDNRTNI
jgi:hypothetical protein